jgi:RNA polymerase sigma-70 factor (ECF subfamily)
VELTEKGFAELLRKGDLDAYKKVFDTYYASLAGYAYTILQDEELAGEMAQTVFYNLWIKRERLLIGFSLKAYLYRALHNACMDHLKTAGHAARYRKHVAALNPDQVSPETTDSKIALDELQERIRQALNALPPECRTVFQLSRFEGLTYAGIAVQLGISVKTVESQMGKALKRLRASLTELITLIIFILWLY